jgi:hypothetical protein
VLVFQSEPRRRWDRLTVIILAVLDDPERINEIRARLVSLETHDIGKDHPLVIKHPIFERKLRRADGQEIEGGAILAGRQRAIFDAV